MTSTQCESRRALRKLASQACSTEKKTPNTAESNGKSGRKIVALIALGLAGSLGWMMCSDWLQRSHAAADAGAKQSKAPSTIEQTAWARAGSGSSATPAPSPAITQSTKASSPKAVSVPRDGNLEQRVEPVEALARRGDPGAAQAVLEALHDEDWRVRSRVIDVAVNAYIPIPETTLIEHAQSDPSAEVRFLALAGIAARIDPAIPQVDAVDPSTARAIGRQALSDASEPVRWQAQQILDTLDARQSATASNDSEQNEVLF